VRWGEIADVRCSVARALSVVGDRWTLLVLRDAFLGARRFEQFERSLRCSPHLLSTRLARLVETGVLERRAYCERPVRHEYRLTEKGRDLYPVIASLVTWGDRWMADADGPPVELEHRPCGHVIHPALHCPECGEVIDPRAMRARLRLEPIP
jgi:DNA-binding HxlR family transcriptional regulator